MEEKGEMTFLQHLEELRWHIIRSVLAVVVFGILAFVFKSVLFDKILMAPSNENFWTNRMLCELGQRMNIQSLCINKNPLVLQNTQVSGMFVAHIKISIIAGLVLAFPVVFYEFWRELGGVERWCNDSNGYELWQASPETFDWNQWPELKDIRDYNIDDK